MHLKPFCIKTPVLDYIRSGQCQYRRLVDVYTGSNNYSSRILEDFDYNNDGWTDILVNGNAMQTG